MKPGDLVTIQRWNKDRCTPIWYVRVFDRSPDSEYFPRKEAWEHNETGVILDGRDDIDEMTQVLLKGKIVWAPEKLLEVIE